MTEKTTTAPRFDRVKWLVAIALTGASVWGNIYFAEQPFLYRLLVLVAVAALIVFFVLQTSSGNAFLNLLKGTRVEIRKVVWPSRQETLQTTLIVLVVVAVITMLLWLFDTFFSWLIALLIG